MSIFRLIRSFDRECTYTTELEKLNEKLKEDHFKLLEQARADGIDVEGLE